MNAGGILQILIFVDAPELEQKFGSPFIVEQSYSIEYPVVSQFLHGMEKLETLDVCFVSESGPHTVQGHYGFHISWSNECRAELMKLYSDLKSFSKSIPEENRDYERALDQYNQENPLEENPVLYMSHSEKKQLCESLIPQNILEAFNNTKNGNDLAKLIINFTSIELEKLCTYYPLVEIDIYDNNSLTNINRFESITILAEILVRYDWVRQEDPNAQLPKDYPAQQIADILVPRIISYIQNKNPKKVCLIIKNRIYQFAMALMNRQYYKEAIECLKVSRPSLKNDDDYWLAACYFNIAGISQKKEDINEAITIT